MDGLITCAYIPSDYIGPCGKDAVGGTDRCDLHGGYTSEPTPSDMVACPECGGSGDCSCDKCNRRSPEFKHACDHCEGKGFVPTPTRALEAEKGKSMIDTDFPQGA